MVGLDQSGIGSVAENDHLNSVGGLKAVKDMGMGVQ